MLQLQLPSGSDGTSIDNTRGVYERTVEVYVLCEKWEPTYIWHFCVKLTKTIK